MSILLTGPKASLILNSFIASEIKCSRVAGYGIPVPAFQEVIVVGEPPTGPVDPEQYDIGGYAYSGFTSPNHSTIRDLNLQAPISDTTTYSIYPGPMNVDGTWQNWDEYWWVYACAAGWVTNGPPAVYSAQFQNKIRLYGPAKGTLMTFPDFEYFMTDPWSFGDPYPDGGPGGTPLTATYVELVANQSLEIVNDHLGPFLYPPESDPGKVSYALAAFRWGKQPSDFSWYNQLGLHTDGMLINKDMRPL